MWVSLLVKIMYLYDQEQICFVFFLYFTLNIYPSPFELISLGGDIETDFKGQLIWTLMEDLFPVWNSVLSRRIHTRFMEDIFSSALLQKCIKYSWLLTLYCTYGGCYKMFWHIHNLFNNIIENNLNRWWVNLWNRSSFAVEVFFCL